MYKERKWKELFVIIRAMLKQTLCCIEKRWQHQLSLVPFFIVASAVCSQLSKWRLRWTYNDYLYIMFISTCINSCCILVDNHRLVACTTFSHFNWTYISVRLSFPKTRKSFKGIPISLVRGTCNAVVCSVLRQTSVQSNCPSASTYKQFLEHFWQYLDLQKQKVECGSKCHQLTHWPYQNRKEYIVTTQVSIYFTLSRCWSTLTNYSSIELHFIIHNAIKTINKTIDCYFLLFIWGPCEFIATWCDSVSNTCYDWGLSLFNIEPTSW